MRKYHFGATLAAIGIALWILYGVGAVKEIVKENLVQTHCNQGLLLLESTGHYDADRIAECPSDIKIIMRGEK